MIRQSASLKWTGRLLFQLSLPFEFRLLLRMDERERAHVRNILVIRARLFRILFTVLCVFMYFCSTSEQLDTEHLIVAALFLMSRRVHFKQLLGSSWTGFTSLADWIRVLTFVTSFPLLIPCTTSKNEQFCIFDQIKNYSENTRNRSTWNGGVSRTGWQYGNNIGEMRMRHEGQHKLFAVTNGRNNSKIKNYT